MFNQNELFKDYPEILTAKMIAQILGIGYTKALHTIQYGEMQYIKIGNTYRVPKKSFIEWLFEKDKREIEVA
ncbi:MAG: helix-turn-helix domain-containing protein [Clostridiales bacterium]|jgi:excisionase family DNA binding protein|nr:helix-turn-helix domain-containing protein [Clostridiales bacterium]